MFQIIWRIIQGSAQITEEEANNVYKSLVMALVAMFGLTFVMWGLNAIGAKEINYIFFFFGGMLILIMGFTPRLVGLSAVGGFVINGLNDKDKSQGMVKGIQGLIKAVSGILLGFWIASGVLATWSFREAPMAFFPIAAMALTIGVTVQFYGMKGGVFKWVVLIYALGVIGTAFYQTFPKEWKEAATPAPRSSTPTTRVAPAQTSMPNSVGVVHSFMAPEASWSTSIAVSSDRCIRWWGKNPDGNEFATQVRGVVDSKWVDWEEFKQRKAEGKIRYNIGWIRFQANEPNALVSYSFHPKGTCT